MKKKSPTPKNECRQANATNKTTPQQTPRPNVTYECMKKV